LAAYVIKHVMTYNHTRDVLMLDKILCNTVMPRKKLAARVRAQNIHVANQKHIDQCEFIQ
jgi:hypothetical protein